MRFEIVNTLSADGAARVESVPVGTNPVFLGSADSFNDGRPQPVHVRLQSAYIGGVAAAVGNTGTGWELWNHHSRDINFGTRTLTPSSPNAPIAHGDSFALWPYEIRVFFEPGELNTPQDDRAFRARQAADLVRTIRKALLEHYGRNQIDRELEYRDDYIQRLEEDIAEQAALSPGFPPDDSTPMPLGNYLAGVSVRSELLFRIVARAGERAPESTRAADGWQRLRTSQKRMEEKFDDLVTEIEIEVGVNPRADLTAQLDAVDERFWDSWQALLDRRGVDPPLRRYLALRRLKKEIKDVWYGHGPLEELLDDPSVSEIMVVDKDHIFIEKNGRLENTGRQFIDTEAISGIISRIVDPIGRKIDTLEPIVDARMGDGSRVNVVIKPIALRGPYLTIRRFPSRRLTIDQLIAKGSLTRSAANFLRAVVVGRRNVIVAGGTGTGKTTMLNCLSRFIPDHERIITIEDTAELQLLEAGALDADVTEFTAEPRPKEHVVPMEAKPKNLEGRGQKTIRDLVITALRMRPDRVVVGECRGPEAIDMLQAMNTGHDGSLTTLHANSPHDVIGRLEVLCQMDPKMVLPVEAIHRQIVSAIDLIVQLSRVGERKVVSEIAEVVGLEEGGGVRLVPLFDRRAGTLRPTGHLATFTADLIAAGLVHSPLDLIRDDP